MRVHVCRWEDVLMWSTSFSTDLFFLSDKVHL
jgi:hypothetical protein